ncbi:hypothetical protein DUNSADRAFT_17913 [Dunaliella salina]|uniref:Uncharacterized protein n=1 Tax=Dunaliella salina TaxID=3046 RepID=A0ABQ7H935_DUNSA|nr:hypothetical protein DUNSADRAFT_17913 [Dunaliella salina]|eukprot:KAF5843335.1 hypothetical protein DUNSADRAFT_17913 [Dunaliella salina]
MRAVDVAGTYGQPGLVHPGLQQLQPLLHAQPIPMSPVNPPPSPPPPGLHPPHGPNANQPQQEEYDFSRHAPINDFAQHIPVTTGILDKHRTDPVVALYIDWEFHDDCLDDGFPLHAKALRCFGLGYLANEMKGLCVQLRLRRLYDRALLCAHLLRPFSLVVHLAFPPKKCRSQHKGIAGMYVQF